MSWQGKKTKMKIKDKQRAKESTLTAAAPVARALQALIIGNYEASGKF